MKRIIKKSIFGMMCLLSLHVHADQKRTCPCPGPKVPEPSVKMYVQPNEIELADGQIFVKMGSELQSMKALFSDKDGFYVLAKKRQGRCPEEYWECDTCGGCSPWYAVDCDWCGYN